MESRMEWNFGIFCWLKIAISMLKIEKYLPKLEKTGLSKEEAKAVAEKLMYFAYRAVSEYEGSKNEQSKAVKSQ